MRKIKNPNVLFAVTQSRLPLFLNRGQNRGICIKYKK